ncbi:hypothetical protein ACHAXN_000895 [Cyclotella atomus]
MPSFQHNLMGIGKLCDNDCKVVFDKATVTVFANDGSMLLKGWREQNGARLWRFSLIPNETVTPTWAMQAPSALNAHDLPSVSALVHYLHAAAGFPVRSTWLAAIKAGNYASWPGLTYANVPVQLRQGIRSTRPKIPATPSPPTTPTSPSKELHVWAEPISKLYTDDKSTWLAAIKAGNYASWPGLTYANVSKYCPSSDETIKGHLTQVRQGIRSTKPKVPATPSPPTTPTSPSKELHLWSEPISKLYTDDMGRFSVRSRSGNQYIMLGYHCDSNAILVEPFQSRHDRHRIPAYNRLMSRLKARGHTVDHQVLDNETSAEYIRVITEEWKATYQLVPPDIHRRNLANCHHSQQAQQTCILGLPWT